MSRTLFPTAVMLAGALLLLAADAAHAAPGFDLRHPRPSGYAESDAPGTEARIDFVHADDRAGMVSDLVARFPKDAVPGEVEVARVEVNGAAVEAYQIRNEGVLNGNRRIHGIEDFDVTLYAGWQPAQEYRVQVAGRTATGAEVTAAIAATAPAAIEPVKSVRFSPPSGEIPYHHVAVTLAKEAIEAGKLTHAEVDGKRNRDARVFNTGIRDPQAGPGPGLEGESAERLIDGARDAQVVLPCNWSNGGRHSVRITIDHDGTERVYEASRNAPGSGGYWDAAWPRFVSLVLHETAGAAREGEPVHIEVGVMADDITDARKEVRVVTYDPDNPKADSKGYVVAPHQLVRAVEWRDKEALAIDERDARTGERIYRYIPTTTLELVFAADVRPYEQRVYQVLYGNPDAEAISFDSDLRVQHGEGFAQHVENDFFTLGLLEQNGVLDTVHIHGGEGEEPVLLEHKVETNGAVHWNPGVYAPPVPWVHVSDWKDPAFREISGPVMHRTRSYDYQPMLDSVSAHVSYSIYAHKPYVIQESMMEVHENIFVQALRNGEVVFNQDVLNEFVWKDHLDIVHTMMIEDMPPHPIQALRLPPNTPWLALINREAGVGFAGINLSFEAINRYGDPVSKAQPYIYVQNGPWIYWARCLVYPFGGKNFTRMMPVRRGSIYIERYAWLPFRLGPPDDPFRLVEDVKKKLENPLSVMEWMGTDERTPEGWIMPLLTMPFDEGVEGALTVVDVDELREN